MSAPIGITMGDPAGVGPEIVCRALRILSRDLPGPARSPRALPMAVIGTRRHLEAAERLLAREEDEGPRLRFVDPGEAGHPAAGGERGGVVAVPLHDVDLPGGEPVPRGEVSPAGGEIAYRAVVRAVELARAGAIRVIVTAPLNKAALHAAGHEYDGHTGLLQHLTGAPASFMLLASERLSTIHVSTHVSLEEAIRRCRPPRILATIEAADRHLRRLGTEAPRIAVAGLNPHCGEGGLFGREDMEHIRPAVDLARARGIEASGPWPPDSVFLRASRGEFDVVVAQYHDQGHIPTKLIAFDEAVNVTLGLPIERTSVDHGTAFDIAWQGRAEPANMLSAIAYARRIAEAGRAEEASGGAGA